MTLWIIAILLILLAVGFISFAAFSSASTTVDGDTATVAVNVRVQAEHEAEVNRQLAAAEIDAEQHRELIAEARRKLLAEQAAQPPDGDRGGRWLIWVYALALPVSAGILYWQLGAAPDVAIADALATSEGASALEPRIRARLQARPDNPYYWLLLGRISQSEGHFATAANAFAKAVALMPEDGAVHAHYAQALFLASGNKVTPAVESEIARAIALDPANSIALELSGIAAFAKSDFRAAILAWQGALQQAAADPEAAKALGAIIAKARERLGEPPTGSSIRIRVTLADALHADPGATVFVFVREWRGRPMPVMARRLSVADLPAEIVFNDDMALAPGRDLSSVAMLELVARVSAAGTPEPGPGDLEGSRGPLTLKDGNSFDVVIDAVRPAVP